MADIQYGLTVSPARRNGQTTIPYIRVANVLRDKLDLDEVKEIGQLQGDEAYELAQGDVLVVEGHANPDEIGRTALWDGSIPKCAHQNHIIRVRCSNNLDPRFLVIYLNSLAGRRHFRQHAKSTSGLNTINSTVVRKAMIPTAELGQQGEIVSLVNSIKSGQSRAESRKIQALAIKHTLLQKLGGAL